MATEQHSNSWSLVSFFPKIIYNTFHARTDRKNMLSLMFSLFFCIEKPNSHFSFPKHIFYLLTI